jgi:hypothetical protein
MMEAPDDMFMFVLCNAGAGPMKLTAGALCCRLEAARLHELTQSGLWRWRDGVGRACQLDSLTRQLASDMQQDGWRKKRGRVCLAYWRA